MTTQEVALPNPRSAATSEATAIEQARAVAEVAAAVKVAQDFPRDAARSLERMRQACRQRSLAERAFYSLPRAGGKVEGSTVHLARELANCWGNVDYGIRELRRDDDAGVSEMQAWAWDQEANVRSSRSFIVPHARMVRKQRQALTDLADIANNNNSVAARAVRETIFTVLPVWFRTEAEDIAARTLQGGESGKTPDQMKADAIAYYRDTFNVTQQQLETNVGRPASSWTPQDVAGLRVLSGELGRGEKKVDDEFPRTVTAEEITGHPSGSNFPADGSTRTEGEG